MVQACTQNRHYTYPLRVIWPCQRNRTALDETFERSSARLCHWNLFDPYEDIYRVCTCRWCIGCTKCIRQRTEFLPLRLYILQWNTENWLINVIYLRFYWLLPPGWLVSIFKEAWTNSVEWMNKTRKTIFESIFKEAYVQDIWIFGRGLFRSCFK